jgi:hypothetical protein
MNIDGLKKLIRECIREIKLESLESTGLINGQSNQVAATRVNKILSTISKGFFSDESWEGINKIFAKLKEAGLEVNLLGAKYGGQSDSNNGMPTYKEWQISIPFVNNKGKEIELIGVITAHGAGTVEDPLSRYDITAYVTPVAKRGTSENLDSKPSPISSDEPYGVMDTQTKKIVYKTTYANRNRARRYAEKANLEYGAHKFQPVVLKRHGMVEEWEPYDDETDSFGHAPEPRMDKTGTGNKQDTSVDSDLDKWLMGFW